MFPFHRIPPHHITRHSYHDSYVTSAICQSKSLTPPTQVDFEKLARLSGMASKASATTKWYKMRQKYMPYAITPKKRKGDINSDVAAGEDDGKPKVKTPRQTKAKSPKKTELEENDEVENKQAVKKEASAAKTEEED